ncbi:MAG TPA: hypothetical protein VFN91_07940 [Myxococcaceae bacterium]|nr:hypothetical protein [Myxococcaceae bacterium]
MKRRISLQPLALLGLLLAACSADPTHIVVLNARAPGKQCDFSDNTLYVSDGSLDLRPYVVGGVPVVSSSYFQVFSWENNLQAVETSVNGQIIDNGSGNDFVADSIVYEYQYTDPSVTLATETANTHAVVTAGALASNNSVGAELVQPGAYTAISNSTAIDTKAQTLLVTFQIFGKLVGGNSIHSNKVSFPVTFYRSSTTPLDCSAQGQVPNGGVCNIPGRDQPISCKNP